VSVLCENPSLVLLDSIDLLCEVHQADRLTLVALLSREVGDGFTI
jgi:hypothetical protein